MATSSPEDTTLGTEDTCFSSLEIKETLLSRFGAARLLLVPGCKRSAIYQRFGWFIAGSRVGTT